jgi:hypothetical protein
MIEALKLDNIERVEGVLSKLTEPSKNYDLHLPAELHNLKFGGIAAAIQLVVTWAKRHPTARVSTYVKSSVKPEGQVDGLSHFLPAPRLPPGFGNGFRRTVGRGQSNT